jgi:hypothetical protein
MNTQPETLKTPEIKTPEALLYEVACAVMALRDGFTVEA